MARRVLVFADLHEGRLSAVTHEMLGAAAGLAMGGEVAALIVGDGVGHLAEGLGDAGADKVFLVEAPELQQFTPDAYRKAFLEAYRSFAPEVVLFAHSALGRDLAATVAMRLGVGQISDVVKAEDKDGEIVYTRPIFAGKAFQELTATDDVAVVTVRPNNFAPLAEPAGRAGTRVPLEVSYAPMELRTLVREVARKAASGVDLSEAKIVVSGWRGVKSAQGFAPLRELAELLGGALGASRAACDAGYCDYALQVGQTGKVVTPDLYIACGISGAIQHVAGMSNSKVIVAINKDPHAPIFKIADYGIVGDLFEVVPQLTAELREMLTA